MNDIFESKVVVHHGFLFIEDPWENCFTVPVETKRVWPTGVAANYHPEMVGMSAHSIGDGIYRTSDGSAIRLLYGGRQHEKNRIMH